MRRIMLAAVAMAAMAGGAARADLLIDFEEVGSAVVVAGSGSVNTAGLTLTNIPSFAQVAINPSAGYAILGPAGGSPRVDEYSGFSGPAAFGPGMGAFFTSGSGDALGLIGAIGDLYVPFDYVSGSSLSATDTFASSSFASLGLTPGTYVYTLPHGTITVQIGPVSAVPEPSSLAMLGTAAVAGLAWARRRKRAV